MKMGFTRSLFLAAAALALGFAAPASATVVIDQNFVTTDHPDNGTGLGITTTSLGQTFTVGVTGKLAAVEFNILKFSGMTGDVTVDIRSLAGGAPDSLASNALASATVANGDIATYGPSPYAWTTILVDFSAANIMVTAGDMLSFVLSSPIGQEFGVQTDYTDGYAGGSRWSQNGDGNAFDELADADLAFNTYVDLPEPGTLAVFGLGLAGLAFARRRKAA
jgi:hypothetical protein